jgi:hypothetical protein
MKKVVINDCYGGFSLSPKALLWLYAKGMTCIACDVEKYYGKNYPIRANEDLQKWREYLSGNVEPSYFVTIFSPDEKFVLDRYGIKDRSDPLLIECIETLGSKDVSGQCAKLKIIEIPDDIEYTIEEYDGIEHIAETHRTWS